jgi:hypothetical protein
MKITLKVLTMPVIALLVLFATEPGLHAQEFDFKTLDKLGVNAKSSSNVTLDGDTLKLAAGMLANRGDKDPGVSSLAEHLRGVYVRSYEFDKPGEYAEADLAPLRTYLKQQKWKNIVDVREVKEWTQIFFLPAPDNNKLEGVAVVSTAPTKMTVVYIDGEINMDDLHKLSGNMGIPDIKLLAGDKSAEKNGDKTAGK